MRGVDPDRHLLDKVFSAQADERLAESPPAGTIVLFDSYCVHQALAATKTGPRTFLRVAYSTRQYDRLGNSVNLAFSAEYADQRWRFEPRPLPGLADPPIAARVG